MTRGVLYMNWGGDPRVPVATERSGESVRKWHPDIEIVEKVIVPGDLLSKARMMELSPFDTTLFLDADTVVLGPLDHGFEKAEQHGLAMCINECPWARRYNGLADCRDLQEWNTGVMFFTHDAQPVFDAWHEDIAIDSSLPYIDNATGETRVMACNDQASFALAIEQTGFNPWVLPLNWNYRPIWQITAFGPVRIWHDYSDVPENVLKWNDEQNRPDAVLNCGRFR